MFGSDLVPPKHLFTLTFTNAPTDPTGGNNSLCDRDWTGRDWESAEAHLTGVNGR